MDSKHAQSLTHCDVALFKGVMSNNSSDNKGGHGHSGGQAYSDYKDNKDSGIVHRAPRVESRRQTP